MFSIFSNKLPKNRILGIKNKIEIVYESKFPKNMVLELHRINLSEIF